MGKEQCLPMQETPVQSLGWQDPLEKEMATHFSILAWEIPWRGESGRLVHGMQRVRLDLVTKEQQKTITAGEVYCLNNTTDWWL